MGDRVALLKDGLLQQVDTPRNLYDRPDNVFVAGFIGSPAMNLVDVQLTEQRRAPSATARCRSRATLARSWRPRARTGATLGFRPESVEVVGAGEGFPFEVAGRRGARLGRLRLRHPAPGPGRRRSRRQDVHRPSRRPPATCKGETIHMRIRSPRTTCSTPTPVCGWAPPPPRTRRSDQQQAVQWAVRAGLDDAALSQLHALAFGRAFELRPWSRRLSEHSLSWVSAHDDSDLVGFVNVAWDGGLHAFLVDTMVHPDSQRSGLGRRLVREAAQEAVRGGCSWLHVDFEPHLRPFYLDACGFRPTDAGLLPVDRLRP